MDSGGDDDGEGGTSPRPAAGAVDDDLAALRGAIESNRIPEPPRAPGPEASSLSPSWLRDDRDHEPAAEPPFTPQPPAITPAGTDEWESLRRSGDAPPAGTAAAGSSAGNPSGGSSNGKGRPGAVRTLLELPLLLVVAALIAFAVRTFVAQAFYIPSESMTPQLQINDRIVVSKLAYRLHEPRRGDIVVFDNPEPETEAPEPERSAPVRFIRGIGEAIGLVQPSTEEFIKRVVGLPGETVEGRDNTIFINGRPLVEPYLNGSDLTGDFEPVTVPDDHLFVMGDNRDGSRDSRFFGPIEQSTIVGRTVVRVWPLGDASFL